MDWVSERQAREFDFLRDHVIKGRLSVAFIPGLRLDYAALSTSQEILNSLRESLTNSLGGTEQTQTPTPQDATATPLIYRAADQSSATFLPDPYFESTIPFTSEEFLMLQLAAQPFGIVTHIARTCHLAMYDFDVATLLVDYHLVVESDSTAEIRLLTSAVADSLSAALKTCTMRISQTAVGCASHSQLLREISSSTFGAFSSLYPRTDVSIPALAAFHTRVGCPLWNHTIYQVTQQSEALGDFGHSRPIDPRNFIVEWGESVSLAQSVFTPGLHASIVEGSSPEEFDRISRVVDSMHAWWTATWMLDLELLAINLQMRCSSGKKPGISTDQTARELAELSESVDLMRARQDTNLLNLGGLDLVAWKALARVWDFHHNLESISRKSQAALTAHDIVRADIAARQARRFNRIAAIFTLIATLSSLIAVVIFLVPTADDESTPLPTKVLVLVSLTALGSIALLWSLSRAMPSRGTRGTQSIKDKDKQ